MKSAILCKHANEVPHTCKCPKDCYCKSHTCKIKKVYRCTDCCDPDRPDCKKHPNGQRDWPINGAYAFSPLPDLDILPDVGKPTKAQMKKLKGYHDLYLQFKKRKRKNV